MGTIYTIGHGTRSTRDLVAVLSAAGVGRLIDVRRFPGSRRHPHLSREALEVDLPGAGIGYEWRGEHLGGRRSTRGGPTRHPAWRNQGFRSYADFMDTRTFRDALIELEAEAGSSPPAAIMCAETLWWKCHRRLISDALTLRGTQVVHLVGLHERQSHKLHPSARAEQDGWPVYDLGETSELNLDA
ncbi:MAG: DUF488 family protein [Actinomycetota bacterium]